MRKDSLLFKHAKTFYWAGLFLPKDTLEKCSHLYDFCRTLDDIADQKKELSFKKKQFKIFKTKFKERSNSLPVIKNIWRLIDKENISKKIVLDLFDGVESDLKKTIRVTSKNNLLLYSYRVAGTVGLMMAKILKVNKKGSLMGAIDLGVAMQLTNIARDVIEDKKNNRFYISHISDLITTNSYGLTELCIKSHFCFFVHLFFLLSPFQMFTQKRSGILIHQKLFLMLTFQDTSPMEMS
ncbi:squalene/phytoene synthase family protein [Pelagibacteraceae bacterium]|nr:squalene/phytoene synthase family protein [Pelagibacteraceae bacterium]